MPLAMKADITGMVEPYYEKGKIEGKIEDARKFLELGVKIEIIEKATGLSKKELKKYGIIKK